MRVVNDNLEQQIALIYDYWFIQFEYPNIDEKPYKTSGGKMTWSNVIKRDIPQGWKIASIVTNPLSTVIKPGIHRFDTKEYLATAEVNGTSISTGTLINYDNRESRANMQPSVNSVWFAKMKNSIKHLYLNEEMKTLINTTILSTGFCGIQCNTDAFEYISSFVSNPLFESIKDSLAHGATQEAVNKDDMESIKLIVPNKDTLHSFHLITEPLYSKISKNICENRKLTALRDWLLPMLMNGQASIED